MIFGERLDLPSVSQIRVVRMKGEWFAMVINWWARFKFSFAVLLQTLLFREGDFALPPSFLPAKKQRTNIHFAKADFNFEKKTEFRQTD